MKKNSTQSIILELSAEKNQNIEFWHCWKSWNQLPNKVSVFDYFTASLFSDLVDNFVVESNISTQIVDSNVTEQVFSKINDNIYLSYLIVDKNSPNSLCCDLIFYYKTVDDLQLVNQILDSLDLAIDTTETTKGGNLYNIKFSQGQIQIQPLSFDIDKENISLFYSKKTFNEISKLKKKLKKISPGIAILNGQRGTGKTEIIKWLSKVVQKTFIHIPGNLVDLTINNPEFTTILSEYQNPIIVLDDCENIFVDAFGKETQTVNNIIQMVDGLNSAENNIQIISIFNTDSDMELPLVESNNFIQKVDFHLLSPEESNSLSKSLGRDKNYKNKTRLVDIIRGIKKTSDKKIGF